MASEHQSVLFRTNSDMTVLEFLALSPLASIGAD